MADQSWVEDRSIDILKTEPNITAMNLRTRLTELYDVDVGYDTVYRGKERALAQLYGSWDDSFRRLFNFKAEIDLRSPGSIVEVDTITKDGKVYFNRFFMCLKPCVDGFHAGCRPYLSIDATALNGKWNGQLASCTALDGHNWMFPIAIAFFQTETEDNWAWFMSNLYRAIGHMPTLAISTDACKGLENAVRKVFPQAERRQCFRHLMQNFVKKFQGDVFGRMWPAAKAYKETSFQFHMKKILEADPSVGEYLNTYHSLLWMRCKFNTDIKCDYIHNNLSESFNNWTKDYKDLLVDELADTYREKIMILMNKRRSIGELLQGKMLPAVIQQINNRSRGLGHLKAGKSSDTMAEVRDTSKKNLRHVVKLEENGCTCLEWQHTGQPCEHALVFLMERRNLKLDNYVHEYFSLDRFRAAYKPAIEPITDRSQWPKVDLDFKLFAPTFKRGSGRRRVNRMKSCLEGGTRSKSKKKEKEKKQLGSKNRCKRCNELGHRQAKCPLNGTKKRPRRSRKKVKATLLDVCNDQTNDAPIIATPTTPNRISIIIPPSLENSPRPITRSLLALAMANGDGQSSMHTTSPRQITPKRTTISTLKKITPRKNRRKLCM